MLLFLDFDGVLHPFFPLPGQSDTENALFSSVKRFEQAVRRSPVPIEIVIASTWRNRESLFELRAHFARDIADKIIEGDKDVDGPAPRSAWGVRPQARHASLLLRPHPLTAERVSSWRRARPDPRAFFPSGSIHGSRAGFACSGLKRRLRCEITRP